MKIKYLTTLIYCSLSFSAIAQVGIGTTTVDDSAQLEIVSTDKGVLIPRMRGSQRLAIAAPAQGLLVYEVDVNPGFWYYTGTIWTQFSSSGWSTTGDENTSIATNYIGTSDANDLSVITDNTERLRIDQSQQIGIGVSTPQRLVHVEGVGSQLRIEDGNEALGRVLTSDLEGNSSWQEFIAGNVVSEDDDWQYVFDGASGLEQMIQRSGDVRIGSPGAARYLLDLNNELGTTSFGIGDVEHIAEGDNILRFSHSVSPEGTPISPTTTFFPVLGNSLRRWNEIFAVNGVIQTSDENAKTNMVPLSYGVDDFMKLRPVSFYWKSEKHNNIEIPSDSKQIRYGFIAQELDEVIPEVVYKEGVKLKSEEEPTTLITEEYDRIGVNYSELIALLVKVEQDQHNTIKELAQQNKEMKEFLIKNKK